MNTFASAVVNQEARTDNGMKARKSTSNACVDFFYAVGASRGKNVIPQFVAAYVENRELALRIAQWARDVRGGAGERQIFRDILSYLERTDYEDAVRLMKKTPEIGRWDDILHFSGIMMKERVNMLLSKALLDQQNGLCAKWMPRKGERAVELRKFLGLSPKAYRKLLVGLTKVVETQMCAKDWDNIEFSHVPSLASARYRNAFQRNTPEYAKYVESLVKGEAKVNAGAVYPYDVAKSVLARHELTGTEIAFIEQQWNAMENFIGDASILPMIDVSGSMMCPAGGNPTLTCMNIAISLGLYCADKNTGAFKDVFLTFSAQPQLQKISGTIVQKLTQIQSSEWGINTNVLAAIDKVLRVAKQGQVPQEQMPKMLVIFSDMQFDQCARFDDSAMQGFKSRYEEAGYEMPKIVFWNLNGANNVPVKSNERGVALVSGFSPALMKALLSNDLEDFTPESIMLKTVMVERYDI
jgi:hypothetical protein